MFEPDYQEPNKNINVSKQFVDIYSNFNVVTQVEKMKQLSKKELYLLLTVCLDKFSDEDPVVRHNLIPFKDECMAIFDIQDDKEPTEQDLIDLVNESGDKLPEPLTKDQVRDAKINIINE